MAGKGDYMPVVLLLLLLRLWIQIPSGVMETEMRMSPSAIVKRASYICTVWYMFFEKNNKIRRKGTVVFVTIFTFYSLSMWFDSILHFTA